MKHLLQDNPVVSSSFIGLLLLNLFFKRGIERVITYIRIVLYFKKIYALHQYTKSLQKSSYQFKNCFKLFLLHLIYFGTIELRAYQD